MIYPFSKTFSLLTLGLMLWLFTTGCQKKKPAPVTITPLCQKIHQHVLSLIQRELAALPKTAQSLEQKKRAKKLSGLLKNLESKRGKQRALHVCSVTSKQPVKLAAHTCASKASSTQEVQRCYQPKPKPTSRSKPKPT